MLDRITPDKKNELDKRQQFRMQAVQEIISSEKAYLQQLEMLMNYFVNPLKEQGILTDSSHTTLFGQIEMIYNLNGELLKILEQNRENVANAFLKMAPFFKLYSVYAFDYKNALLLLQDLTSKNPIFRKFIENAEGHPCVQRKLNSLMIIPIQRVPRYKLLLDQVLLYTSPADVDFKFLKESIKLVESTIAHIDSVIEDQEVTQKLLNLQNCLVNRMPNIVKPSRKVIKEGILNKVNRKGEEIKRYCVLMSDIFMYCKILKDRPKDTVVENSLECCCIFPLKKSKVFEMFPGNFKITCQGDGIIFCTNDLHLGQTWVGFIKDAIELHIMCRKTLRKESSKRTPIRKKNMKHFETDYIVSPNKRKCEYDALFRHRRGSDSENESDDQTSCFSRSKDSHLFKKPKTPQPPNYSIYDTRARHLKRTLPSASETLTQHRSILKKSKQTTNSQEEHDPTYGFANRDFNSNRYFRSQNTDTKITGQLISQTNPYNASFKDMLHPLRYRLDLPSTNNDKENIPHQTTASIPRKRVKFEESQQLENCSNDTAEPYKFEPTPQKPGLSLRERIVEFFSKLF